MIDIPTWYNPQGGLAYGIKYGEINLTLARTNVGKSTYVAPAVEPREHSHAFVLGRFQPLHTGHIDLIRGALEVADTVLVVLGSSFEAITLKNPFDFHTRRAMVYSVFQKEIELGRLKVTGLDDFVYRDNKFYDQLEIVVKAFSPKAVYYTYPKDKKTSEYIDGMGGRFTRVYHKPTIDVDATTIRDIYFDRPFLDLNAIAGLTPGVIELLGSYRLTVHYNDLYKEQQAIKKYNEQWANTPFPVQFMATDALIECNNHILLIERKSEFGNGKWALPGGYLDKTETFLQGAARELQEETGLKVDDSFILVKTVLFDDPNRSRRGRMITNVHHWRIVGQDTLPSVVGGDDAGKAFWVHKDELYVNKIRFFSDHYPIIAKIMPEVESF